MEQESRERTPNPVPSTIRMIRTSDDDAPPHSTSDDDAPPHSTSDATCGDIPLKDPPPIMFPPKWTVRGAAKPSVPDWKRDAAYKAKQERIRAKDQRMRNARDKRMR